MASLRIYLNYENAYSAMKYYEQNLGAEITKHIPHTKEYSEEFGLIGDTSTTSTFDGEFKIDGTTFMCSDRFGSKEDFNTSFNPVIVYKLSDEKVLFDNLITKVRNCDAKITFESLDGEDNFYMFRFIDKYNITWSLLCY